MFEDVKVFFAPEGVLWIEEGVYVAEERNNKNVSKNKYLQAAEKSWRYIAHDCTIQYHVRPLLLRTWMMRNPVQLRLRASSLRRCLVTRSRDVQLLCVVKHGKWQVCFAPCVFPGSKPGEGKDKR
jgi:hypothetical protein